MSRLGSTTPVVRSQVFRSQSRRFGDTGEHPRADLLAVVESERDVGPAVSLQDPV
jgi:hypothetical protein